MKKFDKEKFAQLLDLAIGERSLNQYALNCGISSAHISRLNRCLLDTPPHPEVLEKMANASQGRVSYQEFMDAAGYLEDNQTNLKDIRMASNNGVDLDGLSEEDIKQVNDFVEFIRNKKKD